MTASSSVEWPRYYPVGLAAWLIGVPVAAILFQLHSGVPIASEQGPLFGFGCVLFTLLGVVCLVTGFTHSGSFGARSTWFLAGLLAFLMLGIEHDALWGSGAETDVADGLGWALTGAMLLAVTRAEHLPTLASKLLAIGFALQSAGLCVDLADNGGFGVSPAHAITLNTVDEILDLVFVVPYCASFFVVLVHLRLATLSGDTSSAVIHRGAWTARWHADPLRSLATSLLWTFVFPLTAIGFTWRNGRTIARRTGRSVTRQLADQLRLAFTCGVPPSHYYVFELFDDALRSKAVEYLFRHETKGFAYAALRPRPISPLTDKLAFFRRCWEEGLSVVPVLVAIDSKGQVVFPAAGPLRLPPTDLFVKPNPGKGGRGAERWDYAAEGFRSADGILLSERKLLERLARPGSTSGCIVQPRVLAHSALADLSTGALLTVRLVTCRNLDERFEATNAVFRMARGRNATVDNFHAGGIAARVDIASGQLGRATDLGKDATFGWTDVHPDTGARILGRYLPLWRETVDLALRAHAQAFSDRAVVGWDIAILNDGPAIVEGNSSPDLDIVQRTHRLPVGAERLGVLLASLLVHGSRTDLHTHPA